MIPPEPWSSATGWREFLDQLSDAVIVLDERARVVLANTAALRLLPCEAGLPVEQLGPRLGDAALHWLKRAAAAGGGGTSPLVQLADGRPATLAWHRLDARHSALRIAPAEARRGTAGTTLRGAVALPVDGMREVVAFLWESPFPAVLQGPDFRFVDANQAFLDFCGFAHAQVVGRDALELQPEEDRPRIRAARERILAARGTTPPELGLIDGRLIDASGRERRYRAVRRTLVDAAGAPLYLGVLQDTTAEHVAQERADRSLRELDDWFDLSPVGMVLFDEGGLLLRSNPAFDAFTGVPLAALADAPEGLQVLLAADGLSGLEPGAAPLQQHGWVAVAGAAARPLRATLRCHRAASGRRRYMAVVEDRSAEEERELALLQIGALIETAGVGLASFQESSGWVRLAGASRADGRGASGGAAALQSIGRDIVAPESMAEFERLQAALQQREPAELRYAIDHPELGRRWLLTRVEPATMASGKRTTSVVTLDITEQHAAQQRTEQLLNELATILDSTTAGIAYLRAERLVRCNQRFEAMLGWPAGSAAGRSLHELFARHAGSERVADAARAALAGGSVYEAEFSARDADAAALRWYTLSLRRIEVPGGAPEAIAVLTDVARLKAQQQELEHLARAHERAERAIALQAERTRAILDSVLVGIVTVGPQGIEWMNRSARRMFGGELADFIDRPIASVATQDAMHPFRRGDALLPAEGQAETFECPVQARDGRVFWIVGNVVATAREPNGRQLTYALLDIERRREAEARMSQAQTQLQRIIEAAPLAITLCDAATLRVLQVNAVAAADTGRAAPALIGLAPEQMFDAPTAAQRRADMEGALAGQALTQHEYRITRDGRARVWDARYLPLASRPDAPPDQLLMVATDVTEQRAAQEARLEAAIVQREMLVKEVHHRIKNNLQGVAGLLQQIAQRKPEVAAAIAEVVGQVQAIAQVYGLQVGTSGPLQLIGVVQAIAASVQRTFGQTIRFTVEGASAPQWRLPEAEAIPIALTLNELLTNAVKHSAAPVSPGLSCTLGCSDDAVRLTILNPARLPPGFDLARIPGGVSGLGLVRALLPRRGASLSIVQHADQVATTMTLKPPGVTRDPSAQA